MTRYSSQCFWSSNDPDKFPPRWHCYVECGHPANLRLRKLIVRDEDVCEKWVDLKTVINQEVQGE